MTSTSQHQVYEKNMFWKNLITLPYIVVVQRWLKYTKVKKEYFFFLSFPRRSFSSGSRRAFLSFSFCYDFASRRRYVFSRHTYTKERHQLFVDDKSTSQISFGDVKTQTFLHSYLCARVFLTVCLYYFPDNI